MNAAPSVIDAERFRAFASRWLGLYLDDGKLGALADLLLVDGNPLIDQSVLVGPDKLAMIMKDGKLHRDPRARRAARERIAAE